MFKDRDVLGRPPGARWAEFQEGKTSGVRFALVNSPEAQDQFNIVPFGSEYNQIPQAPGIHYAQGSFDGGSMVLRWNEPGKLESASLVLPDARHDRFVRSTRNWVHSNNDLGAFSENLKVATAQLAAIQAANIEALGDTPGRAYIRHASLRMGPWGVAPTPDDKIHTSCIIWPWGLYLAEKAYTEGATALVFLNTSRTIEITGKHFGGYASFGPVGTTARRLGFNEAIVPAPYLFTENGEKVYLTPENRLSSDVNSIVAADGIGEDLVFAREDDVLLIQPRDTNILQGTSRGHIAGPIARTLGLRVLEQPVTIRDLRSGRITPIFTGNAVKACAVAEIAFTDGNELVGDRFKTPINEVARKVVERFNAELEGRVEPSDKSLLVPVDLNLGRDLLEKYKELYLGI